MKTLGKLRLKEFREMSDFEMKNVTGGYDDYATGVVSEGSGSYPGYCNNKGCTSRRDCSKYQLCATFSDCPPIPTYGQKRCL